MKYLYAVMFAFMAMFVTGCGGTVSDGEVGVRTSWTGEIHPEEVRQGWYWAVTSSVDVYVTKEMVIELSDLRPKTRDNLSLVDMDVEVTYTVTPEMVAELQKKYANRNEQVNRSNYPMYRFVRSVTEDVVYDAIVDHDSLSVNASREEIRDEIRTVAQKILDAKDPGAFKVTRVTIKNMLTDTSIEEAIKNAIAKNKELEAMSTELLIADKQIQINRKKDESLTPAVLREMELQNQRIAIERGKANFTIITGGAVPITNVGG